MWYSARRCGALRARKVLCAVRVLGLKVTLSDKRVCGWSVYMLLAGACVHFLAITAGAQEAGSITITSVEFTGLVRTSPEFARDVAGMAVGEKYQRRALDVAVSRLLRTGRFLAATYSIEERPEGVRVTFEVHERPVVSSVSFTGNTKFSGARLRDKVSIADGQPVDWFAVRDGRDTIVTLYRDEGYGDVEVSFDRQRLEQTGELIYNIEEGPRVRIREIAFEGDTTFGRGELIKRVETKTSLWIFRTGVFDTDRVESDVARLRGYYRDQGFLDARVSYRREAMEKAGDLRVVFTIVEGTQYAIEALEFRGVTVFAPEELTAQLSSKVGETVKRIQIDGDVRAVRSRFWELGYIYAAVRAVQVFSDRPGLVRITIEVEEGDQYRVGRVKVQGNTRTKDKVVRRELNLFPPDDLFDLNEAQAAERRLLETRIFSAARVTPRGDEPGVREAVIDVTEAERAGDFLFGVGVTSNSGLVGNVVLDLRNFDIFDTPRSLTEFVKFKSFYGGGQRLRLELQPGTELNRFRIDFTEPYLFDKPIRFDLSMYLFERGRDGYNERRVGANVSLGKRFEHGRFVGWSGEIALRIEAATVDDVDLFAASDIHDDEGQHLLTSVKLSLARDRTDSRFFATTGDRLHVGYEQFGVLGGDDFFGQLTTRYQWYRTLKTDLLERKSVLQLRAEGGVIVGEAPVFERFYAGGTGTMRGFEFRGVGPRDGIDENNIGGDFLVLLGAEYTYPLIGENIRGHVFMDTGMVGSGAYRAAIGIGVRITVDALGPIPLEFNFAAPVLSDSDDEEQVFSFLIGGLF